MLRVEKVVGLLPDPLQPDTIYYVRTGAGYVQYVTDSTGSIAHTMNVAAAGQQQVFVQPTEPSVSAGVPFIWFETGLGPEGTDMTLWIEDGT